MHYKKYSKRNYSTYVREPVIGTAALESSSKNLRGYAT